MGFARVGVDAVSCSSTHYSICTCTRTRSSNLFFSSRVGPFCGLGGNHFTAQKGGGVLHKKDKKSCQERKSLHRDVIFFFLDHCFFWSLIALICFLFSFTVFLVSLLHCEHLAIGVLLGKGGGLSR